MCTIFIRRHISGLGQGQIFTTRDCLLYGSRAAVDQALSRLVRSGSILRLARGVFMRADANAPRPSVLSIATAKAQAFGKLITSHGAHLAEEFGLPVYANPDTTFIISGSSSSFRADDTVIRLKGSCLRRIRCGETLAGRITRALWYLGKTDCTPSAVAATLKLCGRTDRQELRRATKWLPAWLSHYFVRRQYLPSAA